MKATLKQHISDIYLNHLTEIYTRSDPQLMDRIRASAEIHKMDVAYKYFATLASTIDGQKFLSVKSIELELTSKLSLWIPDLFVIRKDENELLGYIDKQLSVGRKYVRMNMPPHLLNLGARVLKMEICNHVINKEDNSRAARNIYTQVTMLIDICMSISFEAYLENKISIEKHSQALQNHILGSELAETCQSIRADMHDWHSMLLNKLLVSEKITFEELPAIHDSLFTLWIRHKANVFFKNAEEVIALNEEIRKLEKLIPDLVEHKNSRDNKALIGLNEKINSHVKKMGWLFSSLTKQARSLDSGRDTLTKLYNRRYLDVILQKETSLIYLDSSPYVLLMLDVDHFKQINDTYGHYDGDRIIESVAGSLQESVRSSDYVFRYGGDEFLILMVDASINRAKALAEDLLKAVNSNHYTSNDGSSINISLSIGIAQHTGEADYMTIIRKADKALLEAKKEGRNRFSLAA